MRVVIGGVASRQALSVDLLDDLELAVETLFREEPVEGEDLTMTVRVADDCLMVTLGGLKSRLVRRTLITGLEDCGEPGAPAVNMRATSGTREFQPKFEARALDLSRSEVR